MNLIQIKQVDGLQSALNQVSTAIHNLNLTVDSEFESFNDFWNQLTWTSDYVQMNGAGGTLDGDNNIALRLENGGFSTSSPSYFKGGVTFSAAVNHTSSLNLTSNVGQLSYLSPNGVKQFSDCIQPNYSGVQTSSAQMSSSNYIVGARVSSVGSPISLTLPEAEEGKEIKVKDEDFGASIYNITVQCKGSENIDGLSSVAITRDGGYLSAYSNGANWFVLNSSGISI
jgi:hypothetical protein